MSKIDYSNVDEEQRIKHLKERREMEKGWGIDWKHYYSLSFSPHGIYITGLSETDKERTGSVEIESGQIQNLISSLQEFDKLCKARVEKRTMFPPAKRLGVEIKR